MRVLEYMPVGRNVSGESLARSLGISRAAVHKQIQALRKRGYQIDGVRNSGYRLVSRGDSMLPGEVERHYEGADPGFRLHFSREIDSTQNRAKFYADRSSPEFTVVVADRQSAARGRLGREWSAGPGGIWFSMILRPRISPDKAPQLTLLASLSLCRALKGLYKLDVSIKWPNDVMAGGRKAAGILTEMSAETDKVSWVVVGVGINANNELPSFLRDTAVTLREASGSEINRPELLARFLEEFAADYALFLRSGFKPFRADYNRNSAVAGRDVTVFTPDGNVEGRAAGADADGRLAVRTKQGRTVKVIAGDVSLKGK